MTFIEKLATLNEYTKRIYVFEDVNTRSKLEAIKNEILAKNEAKAHEMIHLKTETCDLRHRVLDLSATKRELAKIQKEPICRDNREKIKEITRELTELRKRIRNNVTRTFYRDQIITKALKSVIILDDLIIMSAINEQLPENWELTMTKEN